MKKNLYNTTPLDELEEKLLNDDSKYISVENLESEKLRFQKIAQSSVAKKELLNEVINGTITTKQLSSS